MGKKAQGTSRQLRKDIRRVQQAQNANNINRLQNHIRRIKKKVHVHAKYDPNNVHITEVLDALKKKLAVKSQRLRQSKEANQGKQRNRLSTTTEKN
jgi:hypothetical protein